jgi:putative FmdB family regulatory protein
MPIYEYGCTACGKTFEEWQKISEPALTQCKLCGDQAVERLLSATSFSLKGGGWYKDLYSSSPKSTGDARAETATKPATKPATKTDAA